MYRYPAIKYQQLPNSTVPGAETREIVCLVAPSDDILTWAGIPRKAAMLAGLGSNDGAVVELHGYQRESNPTRVRQLIKFFQSPENVIPTSILLARRFANSVSFKSTEEPWTFGGVVAHQGVIEIAQPLAPSTPLKELFKQLGDILLARHPALAMIDIKLLPVSQWQERIVTTATDQERASLNGATTDASSEGEVAQAIQDDDSEEGDRGAVNPYSPDLHIEDFYREIRLRQLLCERLPFLNGRDDVLGVSRVTLLDYLAPVTVVDGQHRLLGARDAVIRAAEQYLDTDEAKAKIAAGASAEELSKTYVRTYRRVFSATLLLDNSWAEHVFQFVVVNQKVKPISKALLSSIISTSLSSTEIQAIQDRLDRAGIEIDDYRVMGVLTESEGSPFKGLVRKGFRAQSSDERKKLDWPVLNNLASSFRALSGLIPHDRRGESDPSALWKSRLLRSEMIQEYGKSSDLSSEDAWQDPLRGLWLPTFLYFWRKVRDGLASSDNTLTAWGENPAESNVFNGATMRTMLADFVDYLNDKEFTPSSQQDLQKAIDDYLGKLSRDFFARPWDIVGNRVDRVNMANLATYLRKHRKEGRVHGNWIIFKK